jgi:hypothetical protein
MKNSNGELKKLKNGYPKFLKFAYIFFKIDERSGVISEVIPYIFK